MNIKIGLIALLGLLLIVSSTQAQGLDTTYNLSDNDIGFDITIQQDGYLISGSGTETNAVYRFLKIDTAGNILWNKWIGNSIESFIPPYSDPAEVDPFGNIYAAGAYYDSASYFMEPLIVKLNNQGDSIWERHIPTPTVGDGVMYDIFYDTTNHKIYAAGVLWIDRDTSQNVLWVLDTTGNTLLTKFFSYGIQQASGSIVVINDTILMGSFYNDSVKKNDPVIYKLDTLGNVLSYNSYGTNKNDGGAVFNYYNNRLLMHAFLDTLGSDRTNSLFLLDNNCNVIWKRLFTDCNIVKAAALKNGEIIAIGSTKAAEAKIVKLDSLGNTLWERVYAINDTLQSYTGGLLYDFDVDTLNGSIVVVGEKGFFQNMIYTRDLWLLRLDSVGCLIPGCDTITPPISSIAATLSSSNAYSITVNPNPAKSMIMVMVNSALPNVVLEFSLFDLTGKRVLTSTNATNSYGFGEWQLDLSDLPPSLYLYQISDPSGHNQTGKIVIE
jgi:hypothetical protein